jgi:hypothetical protein
MRDPLSTHLPPDPTVDPTMATLDCPRESLAGPGLGLMRLVHLRAAALDRDLAFGAPPDASRLLALRATELVRPDSRATLAANWLHVLEVAGQPPRPGRARAPLCGSRILGAETELRHMVRALSEPVLVSARGVAAASHLLGDGAGPLYDRRSRADLGVTLRQVTALLRPS